MSENRKKTKKNYSISTGGGKTVSGTRVTVSTPSKYKYKDKKRKTTFSGSDGSKPYVIKERKIKDKSR